MSDVHKVLGQTERLILKTRIRVLDQGAALDRIQKALGSREGLRVAFVNAHLANEAASQPAVAQALQDFCLLNDGIGVDIASRILYGRSFPQNLNGTDFTPELLDRLPAGTRLYLLGAAPAVIAVAATRYEVRWPQHRIVGFHHGFFGPDDEAILAQEVRDAAPDIVLVGMGCPRQELWIAKHIPDVAPVGIAIGALFDFHTGTVSRAPLFLRKARLEWMYRLALEPGRLWKRYLIGNGVFLAHVAVQWVRGERG